MGMHSVDVSYHAQEQFKRLSMNEQTALTRLLTEGGTKTPPIRSGNPTDSSPGWVMTNALFGGNRKMAR